MKRFLKIAAIILAAAFVVIQFIRPDFTNPPVNQSETLEASTQVPKNVEAILTNSCKDCHSYESQYPWYSKIQPSAWFLARHIEEGRHEMNLSVWNTYEAKRKRRKLSQMCEQAESHEMPLPSYLWIHRSAKLSDEQIEILCNWTRQESDKLAQAQ
ncbi:MAG: heme-binding domain-containing protein [Acidobacteria bacterium]|nr:heme-binding domain-containing protein [Acidobacteriota bacterium]